MTRLILYRRGT